MQPDPNPDLCLVLTTAPDLEVARRLASGWVERGLVACVNLVPGIESHYRWEGAVEASSEVLLLVKTPRERMADLRSAVAADHPYDVPEFVVLAASEVSAAYAAWARAATRQGS